MECNREEAERCIQIAAQAFKEFKTQRAKNFLDKAEKLYPTQQAKGNCVAYLVCCFICLYNWKKAVDV